MTPNELYELLDKAGVEYEVVEIFEGARWLRIDVEEDHGEDCPAVDGFGCNCKE